MKVLIVISRDCKFVVEDVHEFSMNDNLVTIKTTESKTPVLIDTLNTNGVSCLPFVDNNTVCIDARQKIVYQLINDL